MRTQIVQRLRFAQHLHRLGAISADQAGGVGGGQIGVGGAQAGGQISHPVMREIPTGQGFTRRPCRFHRQQRCQFRQGILGQTPIGGDLAAKNRQKRRALVVERQHIIPRRGRGRTCPVIVKRAHAGIGPDHIGGRHGLGEILACEVAQIVPLGVGTARGQRVALVVQIGRADQGEILLVGNGKDDPPISALKKIAAVVVVKLARHDMRSAHQPDAGGGRSLRHIMQNIGDPRPRRVYQDAGTVGLGDATAFGGDPPQPVLTFCLHDTGAGQDLRAMRLGVAGIQDHKAGILDPAI